MHSFQAVVQDDFLKVNELIINQLHSDVGLVENIGHYIVDAGGKRLRPLLVLLCAGALGNNQSERLKLSAIIEFIHTATLLHDDVVDVSELRRGRPTANANWGNAPSVLVGDFLYSRAFQMMVDIGSLDIMRVMADTTNMISEGEVQQLVNAKNPNITEQDYFSVIHKKTAILFEAACHTASILSGANQVQTDALKGYGLCLGTSFQLMDDVLDYSGDAEKMGKNIGDDLSEGKPTLPLIHALKNSGKEDTELIANSIINGDASELEAIVTIVQSSGGLEYTIQQARHYAEQAKKLIHTLDSNPYTTAMLDLAEFGLTRQK